MFHMLQAPSDTHPRKFEIARERERKAVGGVNDFVVPGTVDRTQQPKCLGGEGKKKTGGV